MKDILESRGIPTKSLPHAFRYLDGSTPEFIADLNAQFGLESTDDPQRVAQFAVKAILTGHNVTVDKVVWYVRRMMPELVPQPPRVITIVGVPVVDNPNMAVSAVEVSDPASVPVQATGRRGRKRNGNSDFCKAVAALEAAKTKERPAQLAALAALGIPSNSAVVYLWKYNNGARE